MAKNKTDKEKPQSQDTAEEVDSNEDEFEDPYPLPPFKGRFCPTYPNARPEKLHTTYPY